MASTPILLGPTKIFKDGNAIEVTLQDGELRFEEVIVKEELVTSGSDSK